MSYNSSAKLIGERVTVEPTATTAGRVRSLHPTKGYRYSRIAPLNNYQPPNLAQRLLSVFRAWGATVGASQ